jgi:hypothetical protein
MHWKTVKKVRTMYQRADVTARICMAMRIEENWKRRQ